MTYVAGPIDEFHAFRAELEAQPARVARPCRRPRPACPGRAPRGADLRDRGDRNYFRQAHGPGWALVGDAGLAMDPVTGQGISDALRDAELLAEAIGTAAAQDVPLDTGLGQYERARNSAVKPMYDFTTDLASFAPSELERELVFRALEQDPCQMQRFLGVIAGAVPIDDFFGPGNLRRLIGLSGFAEIACSKLMRRAGQPRSPRRHGRNHPGAPSPVADRPR